jgi:two-component system cell cycle response regulator DivK
VDLSQWLVLVVEDEEDSIQIVSQVLNHYHIEVRVARDGHECLKMLERIRPTVIVMDLAMPRLNGWQALAAIRKNPAIAEIPVVAVTAYDSNSAAEEALRMGFDAYFPKPIEVEPFLKMLRTVVRP